jgi:hypothetical protein
MIDRVYHTENDIMSDIPQTPASDPAASSTAFKAGLPVPPPPPAELAYRPISGFAIAGFVVASLFALMVLAATVVALYQGAPFFYPVWVLIVPAVALVLSLVARNQIRASEGTRAGEKLAARGFWISLLAGLGYFVYYYVTGLAITSQANTFLTEAVDKDSGFFPHLQKFADNPDSRTDLYYAYLFTVPIASRAGARPEDEVSMLRAHDQSTPEGIPGAINMFRKHYLVRYITAAPGNQVKIEPLGVQSWEYESRSYKVSRIYRITTPEGTVEIPMHVQSSEGEAAGEQRRWFINLPRTGRPTEKQIKLTRLGEGIRALRISAGMDFVSWKTRLNEGQSFDLTKVDQSTRWDRLGLNDEQRKYIKQRIEDLFAGTETTRLHAMHIAYEDEMVPLGGWKVLPDNRVQIEHVVKLTLDPQKAKNQPPYHTEAMVLLETKVPVDALSYAEAPDPHLVWEVRDFRFTRIAPISKTKTGPAENLFVAP